MIVLYTDGVVITRGVPKLVAFLLRHKLPVIEITSTTTYFNPYQQVCIHFVYITKSHVYFSNKK